MSGRTRVNKGDIIAGIPLLHDLYDEKGKLLFEHGSSINSQNEIETLIENGLYIIHFTRSEKAAPALSELHSPFDRLDNIYNRLSALCANHLAGSDFSYQIMQLSTELQEILNNDADACLGAILTSQWEKYSITHQIHTAVICDLLLRPVDCPRKDRMSVMCAALTMNIAMIELQDMLFFQREKLSEGQLKAVRSHPAQGVDILKGHGVADQEWLNAVLQHHESLDGNGYPDKLKDNEIGLSARLLSVADIYCAKLFPRSYRAAIAPNIASHEILAQNNGKSLDQDLVKQLIKEIGAFPPGSFVSLKNKEIAVVTQRGDKSHNPIVHSIKGPEGESYATPKKRDSSLADFRIINALDPRELKVRINTNVLWGYGQ